MATFSLNGKTVEAPDGSNLIEAAALHGVTIPHYCYHPGLSVAGNCRMCLCEVEGARGPQIACGQKVMNGLVVRTDTPAVEKMRKGVQEFLLLNHPIDCPICDQAGECRLQDYYMDYGKYDNRADVPKTQKQKAMDIGPHVVLDQERCILCTRCVRFCDEISKSSELIVSGRGDLSLIETFPGMELDNPYSGNVVDICPVGALTSKDFRFKMRVWFMKASKSVCTGCARGCNVLMDQKDDHVYRYRPRENREVNDWWMCDVGRMSYKAINDGRQATALVRGQTVGLDVAFKEFAGLFQGERPEGAYAVLGSPHASLEDNFVLKRLASQILKTDQCFGYSPTPDGNQDDFLIRADKTPNRRGVAYLGFDDRREALLTALNSGRIQVLIVLGNDLARDPELDAALAKVQTVVYLATHADGTAQRATMVFPVTGHAEAFGSFMNFEGRIQRFFTSIAPKGDALTTIESLSRLGRTLGADFGYEDVESVWVDLGTTHAELSGQSWFGLGDGGLALPSASREPVGTGA